MSFGQMVVESRKFVPDFEQRKKDAETAKAIKAKSSITITGRDEK
jgi:hypothetical protein